METRRPFTGSSSIRSDADLLRVSEFSLKKNGNKTTTQLESSYEVSIHGNYDKPGLVTQLLHNEAESRFALEDVNYDSSNGNAIGAARTVRGVVRHQVLSAPLGKPVTHDVNER